MSLPKPLNKFVTRAQVNHPVLAAKVIRKLTGSSGKNPATAATTGGSAPASNTGANVMAAGEPLDRDNGIEAAKVAAGVPAAA